PGRGDDRRAAGQPVVPVPDHGRGAETGRADLHPRRDQAVLLRRLTRTHDRKPWDEKQEGDALMGTDLEHLAARIGDSLGPGSANMPPWLWRPLLRLLAQGEPVTADDLGQARSPNP